MIPGLKITIMAAGLLMLTGCGVVKKTYQEFAPHKHDSIRRARNTAAESPCRHEHRFCKPQHTVSTARGPITTNR